MNILAELRRRFEKVLGDLVEDPVPLVGLVVPSQDVKFGDYQANVAMPLGKLLDRKPRVIAQEIVDAIELSDLCEPAEIAGPGFINLRLSDEWLTQQLNEQLRDDRLGVVRTPDPRTYVIDYSSPNVAKPMHVGHIRSTVIGDALCHTLRFLGHQVVSDNHLGDWGTQFGMVIYGYKHFRNDGAYRDEPIGELSRLYKLVRRLMDYHEGKSRLPELEKSIQRQQALIVEKGSSADTKTDKKLKKNLRSLKEKLTDLEATRDELNAEIKAVEADRELIEKAAHHADIAADVLSQTARLHAGDKENRELWEQFLPYCRADIQRIYDRLSIRFDVEYGESFYQDRLAGVVTSLADQGLAQESEGAICVFLDGFDTPMLIRKRDGAYLYATTDLATIAYRMEKWQPHAILYVVDHRQSEHFEKLFSVARRWGYPDVEFEHISFGTVLGDDGKPYKTRSGDTIGLEGLLDEAEVKAYEVVRENELAEELSVEQRQHVAKVIGIAALKYADLSHNRTSDYVFNYDKMLALKGNTATYCQYAYARTQNIFSRGQIEIDKLRDSGGAIELGHSAERALGLHLLQFPEALAAVVEDYKPNHLTNYLFELANLFSTFYEQCPVLKADHERHRQSRLLLCDVTGRTIKRGLALLGIDVVEKM